MSTGAGTRFGIPGVIAVIALIVAIGGYAVADDGDGDTSSTSSETLASGATLTGGWAFSVADAKAGEPIFAAISFPIKLPEWLTAKEVHFTTDKDFRKYCEGKVEEPVAASGHLCVYSNVGFGGLENAKLTQITTLGLSGLKEANAAGAILQFSAEKAPAFGYGSYAVTG